ncbi:6984_t:CDS:2, partial [Diversispora eburnea]
KELDITEEEQQFPLIILPIDPIDTMNNNNFTTTTSENNLFYPNNYEITGEVSNDTFNISDIPDISSIPIYASLDEASSSSFYQIKEFTTINSWFWTKYISSILNSMPYISSDHINDIMEVDYPKDLSVSTFYQLLSQMRLLEVIDELIKEYCTVTKSKNNSSNKLEIVIQGQYLTPQSELFQKMFHHLSHSIIIPRLHRCGKYTTRITMPIPSISTIEPIINWLYDHNDQAWMKTMTPDNFEQR